MVFSVPVEIPVVKQSTISVILNYVFVSCQEAVGRVGRWVTRKKIGLWNYEMGMVRLKSGARRLSLWIEEGWYLVEEGM
jgi:hypothetical protein